MFQRGSLEDENKSTYKQQFGRRGTQKLEEDSLVGLRVGSRILARDDPARVQLKDENFGKTDPSVSGPMQSSPRDHHLSSPNRVVKNPEV
mmetsp:Transcript_40318/g.61523  ORF Transcript_40318/g.61523 Transcript_40318/m.61523 type:complete len:90 (-) Transcript_40318:1072-1341(-)